MQAIDAPDDYTVVVRLRRRFSPFVQYFFGPQGVGAIMPAHLLAGHSDLNRVAYNERPMGSGPFRVVAMAARRPDNAGGEPALLARKAAASIAWSIGSSPIPTPAC